jgi:hypothetical protein
MTMDDGARGDEVKGADGISIDDGGRVNQALTGALAEGQQAWLDRSAAKAADMGAEEAARVAGAEAVEADTERRKLEAEATDVEASAPGSVEAADADAAVAEAEKLAGDAVAASLDSDVAAEDSVRKSRFFHHDAAAVAADGERAEKDVGRAGKDLAALDRLEGQVENDEKLATGSTTAPSGA